MPHIALSVHRIGDPDGGALRPGEHLAFHDNGSWRAVLVEGGMTSGEPSVAVIVPLHDGTGGVAIFETSLAIFQAAARAMVAMAETQLGWEMPA